MEFRPEFPLIIGNIDYKNFQTLLTGIDKSEIRIQKAESRNQEEGGRIKNCLQPLFTFRLKNITHR